MKQRKGDGDDDGVKIIVTIVTHRHPHQKLKFRWGAGYPFQRVRPAGELSADNGAKPHSTS